MAIYQGGLYGEYYNNAFIDGVPAITRNDPKIDFDWGLGLITNDVANFVSIRWSGMVFSPSTEEYTFILRADDGVRLYFQGVLVIDRWESCCDDITVTLPLVQGSFYDLRIEYKQYQEEAYIQLFWTSISRPKEIISPVFLYYPVRVASSPYNLKIK